MTYFYSAQCLVILKGGLHSGGLEKTSKVQRYIPAQVTSQRRE